MQGFDLVEGLSAAEMRSQENQDKRARSPHRIHYEAQAEVIRRQLGELDQIREKLGLSQRKICQLLMVDPSAWTRWTKKGESAPPHIYRALQWYMIVQEKLPGLTPQYFIGKDPELLHQAALQRIQLESSKREALEAQIQILSGKNESLEQSIRRSRMLFSWIALSSLIFAALVSFIVWR